MKIEENKEENKDGYKNYLEIDEELNKKFLSNMNKYRMIKKEWKKVIK